MKKVLISLGIVCAGLGTLLLLSALFYPRFFVSKPKDPPPLESVPAFAVGNCENEEISSLSPLTDSYKIEGITPLAQKPRFPSGCESISTVMALRHFGVDISPEDFISSYLKKSNDFHIQNGKNYGPDPKKVFVGDPSYAGSFGCYSPVIEEALKNCVGEGGKVVRCDGTDLQALCHTYITKDVPVIVWASIAMLPIYDDISWFLEDDTRFYWPANEHCLLLVGYTKTHYIFNDPWQGKEVSYPKKLVEQRFEQMGKMSVVLY